MEGSKIRKLMNEKLIAFDFYHKKRSKKDKELNILLIFVC